MLPFFVRQITGVLFDNLHEFFYCTQSFFIYMPSCNYKH